MSNLDILGLVASIFTTSSQIPQVIRTYKTRDVSGISLSTYVIITIGLLLWLTYGIIKNDLPLIVANSTMVLLTIVIAVMKVIFEKK
ncbi:MAG: SemiSWEET transporter [Methylophilaceae bacterium]